MHIYGSKKNVKAKITVLVKSLKAHASNSMFVDVFRRCIGFKVPSGEIIDQSCLSTMLWLIKKLLKENLESRRGIQLNMCDNEERMAIRKAGGDALVATMKLLPAISQMGDFMVHFEDVPASFGRKRLEQSVFKQKIDNADQDRVSLVFFIELLTEALLTHEQLEHERLVYVFNNADKDQSGTVDFLEFKQLIKNVPGMDQTSDYEIVAMFTSAAEEDGEDDQHGEPTLSREEFVTLCQGKLKSVLGREVLKSLEQQIDSLQIGYHSLLSDHIKRLFDKFDTDRTGEISASEFPALMAHIGMDDMTQEQTDAVLKEIDDDGAVADAKICHIYQTHIHMHKFCADANYPPYQPPLSCFVFVVFLSLALSVQKMV